MRARQVRRALICASSIVATALALAACTVTTEVLPSPLRGGAGAASAGAGGLAGGSTGGAGGAGRPRKHYDFWPTTIDVYGGPNVLLRPCGGPSDPFPLQAGYFAPGAPDYNASLAGRLQVLLAGTSSLVERFGSNWKVRSCATTRGTLVQLATMLPVDSCGPDTPIMAGSSDVCLTSPAPLLLINAEAMDDPCHGGAPGSGLPDQPDVFADHFARRLDLFLAARAPQFALVGAQTAWVPALSRQDPLDRICQGKRSDWSVLGIQLWASRQNAGMGVGIPFRLVPDRQAEFKQHHPCCLAFGIPCLDPRWYDTGGMTGPTPLPPPALLNCRGADEMENHWFSHLESFLLENDFEPPR